MRYRLGMRDDGWLVVDTDGMCVAEYGGMKLDGLSAEEAHVMLGFAEAVERGTGAEPFSDLLVRGQEAERARREIRF